ncbi:MAG TPA: hemolysin family protein, partial [Actinomycetota bacterium]|nr:hemolysin family protein [Actinomycetota bacterium]
GITMTSLGLGAIAEPAVAHLIEGPLHSIVPEEAVHAVALTIALTIVVFFHMVVGEMAPKNIAIAEPEKTALLLALPFRVYANIFRPFIAFLNFLANVGVRLLRVEPQDELKASHSAAEIGMIVHEAAESGVLGRFEQRLLTGAVEFGQRDAASVMVPRTEMVAIPIAATVAEIERVALESGLSRLPVYGKDMDEIIGFFHTKDLLSLPTTERDRPVPRKMIRQMLVVPESLTLHRLLYEMRRQRQHFALVVDEHGGTSGVVTLEDVLEELVGDIRDEYDVAEAGVESFGEGRYVVPGTMHLSEAEDKLGLELPEGEYETIAGFLMDRLGRIPKRRDLVEYTGWRIRVLSMHRRRVVQVLVEKVPSSVSDH